MQLKENRITKFSNRKKVFLIRFLPDNPYLDPFPYGECFPYGKAPPFGGRARRTPFGAPKGQPRSLYVSRSLRDLGRRPKASPCWPPAPRGLSPKGTRELPCSRRELPRRAPRGRAYGRKGERGEGDGIRARWCSPLRDLSPRTAPSGVAAGHIL